MNERVAAPEPSSRDSLPTALTDFVRRRFEAAGLPVAAAEAAVRQLATLAAAQPSASARGWFHERGRLAAELLESDASVAAALAAADLDIAGVLEARAERSLRSSGLFEVINGHHRVLRKALGSGAEGVPIRNGSGGAPESVAALADGAAPAAGAAPTPGAVAADAGAGTGAGTGAGAAATAAGGDGWVEAVEDPAALRRYAAAAAQIGAKAWVREGVEWCAEQARWRLATSACLTHRTLHASCALHCICTTCSCESSGALALLRRQWRGERCGRSRTQRGGAPRLARARRAAVRCAGGDAAGDAARRPRFAPLRCVHACMHGA